MSPIYAERQRFGPWWVWLLVGIAAVGAWVGGIAAWTGGDDGGHLGAILLVVVVGVLVPVGFLTVHLDLTVDATAVHVRFFPFTRRTIPLDEITTVEARRYRPVAESGGWGIKGWSRRKVAYNVRGDVGVDLTLRDGRRVLLGSQHAADLAAAIEGAGAGAQPAGS